ncbi:hypothetical protein [Hyalangium versicolor]|uniref:hypothetical protein n=1 Tax=Hyalangium versicolor TaxID=2861190 RepID=UPI001CC910B3|nr:hypothetical protein [Hyalangium versicolor]
MGLIVGCGGGVADETTQEASNLETREDAIPDCSSGDSYTAYYSDASYTTEIGGRGCQCGFWVSWGKTSTYRQYFSEC